MTTPLEPGKPAEDVVAAAASAEVPAQPGTVETQMKTTAATVLANLTDGGQLDVQAKQPPVNEDNLRTLREQLRERPEVAAFRASGETLLRARQGIDTTAVGPLVERHTELAIAASRAFLKDAEADLAAPIVDLPRTRVLVQHGYNHAKALSGGDYKNPVALDALKAWQADIAARQPAGVAQLAASYKRSVATEAAVPKPNIPLMIQWIDLCTGFEPGAAPELANQMQEAVTRLCETYVAEVDAELAKPRPDLSAIGYKIIVPPKYYAQLAADSTIPERVRAQEARVAALSGKR